MQKGIDDEEGAICYYELKTGTMVSRGGFIEAEHEMCACSPDGTIGKDGGIEVKCLNEENHIKVIIKDDIEKKYYWQIQWCMFCSGRMWWDYFGYCKELPEPITSYTKRFERDPLVMEEISQQLTKFVKEFNLVCERLELVI